jgi:cell division protein FtsI (penicillin-binding protein 3)
MWRVILVYVCICLFGVSIITKVAIIQFKEGDMWRARAKSLTTQEFVVNASRGNIYDVSQNLLATSLPYYEIGIDVNTEYIKRLSPSEFTKNADSLSLALADLLKDRSRREYYRDLKTARTSGDRYVQLAKEVSYKQLQLIKKFPLFRLGKNKGGFVVLQTSRRERPFQLLASRTIGYEREDVKPIGLEGAFNQYLKGTSGKRLMQKIAGGVWMPLTDDNEVEPEDGSDVISTIDINIQDVAEHSLLTQLAKNNADHGCAILMEVNTGAIKAIANLARRDSGEYVENYNYAIGAATDPGSTFKLASLMAAMEDGYIDLEDTVDVGNGTYKFFDVPVRDSHRPEKSKMTVEEVFEQSSNVGVAKIIYRYYAKDPQRFVDRLYKFNLNAPLGLAIPGEATPRIKTTKDKDWSGVTLPQMAYGYELTLVPIQILAFYNAVANNGVMVRPQFVQEVRKKGKLIKKFETEMIGTPPICSRKTIEMAKKMMEGVVLRGTGKTLKNSTFSIAGKTGTAQILVNGSYKDRDKKATYQASFVGYFPANNPKYSCIVVVSAPSTGEYYGAQVAGPVFKDIADKVYSTSLDIHKEINSVQHEFAVKAPAAKAGSLKDISKVLADLNVKTDPEAIRVGWTIPIPRDSTAVDLPLSRVEAELQKNIVPNMVGMGAQDALFLLENNGFHVVLKGSGVITKQSLEAGTRFVKGTTIELELT